MKHTFLSLLIALGAHGLWAQGNVQKEPLSMSLFQFQIGGYTPGGDLDEWYGEFASVGFSYAYKTKSNWLLGADYNYLFSNRVNDANTRFRELRFANGMVLGNEGEFINVLVQWRGFTSGIYAGRIFSVIGPNPNSGIVVKFGINYMQHRTWIESREAEIPPLEGAYRGLYDRKRGGIALHQFIGYQNFSNSRMANFFIGFDIYQGFLSDQRPFNVDALEFTDRNYFDLAVGFKVGWVLPVYKQVDQRFYVQ